MERIKEENTLSRLQELRDWVDLEVQEARYNVQQSKHSPETMYNRYNSGREAALRGVLNKIDVLIALEESGPIPDSGEEF